MGGGVALMSDQAQSILDRLKAKARKTSKSYQLQSTIWSARTPLTPGSSKKQYLPHCKNEELTTRQILLLEFVNSIRIKICRLSGDNL